jgi:enoyl-CoA hydratase/carnithine racemase
MGDATLLHELNNNIGYATINRPQFLNALNKDIWKTSENLL